MKTVKKLRNLVTKLEAKETKLETKLFGVNRKGIIF
jgi:hypothetical protein